MASADDLVTQSSTRRDWRDQVASNVKSAHRTGLTSNGLQRATLSLLSDHVGALGDTVVGADLRRGGGHFKGLHCCA